MEIIDYRPEFLDALAGLWHRSWTRAVPDIAAGMTVEELRARIERETAGRWEAMVALDRGTPAGFAGLVTADGQLDQPMVDVPWPGQSGRAWCGERVGQ